MSAAAETVTEKAEALAAPESVTLARLQGVVREQPLTAAIAAGAVGAALGAFVFPRLGRLAFLAAAGYFGNEWWRRRRNLDIAEILGHR